MKKRFVLLNHTVSPDSSRKCHWDLMFEPTGPEEKLATWSIPPQVGMFDTQPRGLPFTVEGTRLPDHRRLYLDYEGDISGDRGRVERIDAGFYEAVKPSDDGAAQGSENDSGRVRYRLFGQRFFGLIDITFRDTASDNSRSAPVIISYMPATRVHSLSRTDAEPTGAPGDTRYFHTDLVIPFLYDLPADGESVRRLKAIEGELVLRTDLPARAAYWILRQLGVSAAVTLEPHSASPESPEHQERQEHPMSSVPDTVSPVFVKEPVRHRWYPVVDQDACTGCLECVNFCMFGVYVIDRRDKPLVEQPDACRDGCPACSRVCPGGAIMFPLYDDPVISGRQRRGIDKNVLSPRATKSSPPSVETAPSEHLLDALLDEVDGMEL